MATYGNNINAEYSQARDAFFVESERENFKQLLKNNPIERLIHEKMTRLSASHLYRNAMNLIEAVEMGQVKDEDMEAVEKAIAHNFAAIIDIQLVHEKELYPEDLEQEL